MSDSEVTIETNPGDIDKAKLACFRELGITRISMGVQSFDDRELDFLKRRHTSAQAFGVAEQIKDAGFSLGIDLIYALPGQSLSVWKKSLGQALLLQPDHISCYSLTIEPDTPFEKKQDQGIFQIPEEDAAAEFFMFTDQFLEDSGYEHYEVSNFAGPGCHRSRHNQKYWDRTSYLGLGPSAHSFDGNIRWWNHANLGIYLKQIQSGKIFLGADHEEISSEQAKMERIGLGLRTRSGVPLDLIINHSPEGALDVLVDKGFVQVKNDLVQPTRNGMLVADSLAQFLI